ncbi:MAG: methyltransferase family protein [Candidatus Thorarchaeota archaeon]|jgi:protein-S-isoprenylcysteine O-methyltransferase Ste14
MKRSISNLIGLPLIIVYFNLGFIFLTPEVFFSWSSLVSILLFSTFLYVDIAIRPVSTKKDEYGSPVRVISVLLLPLILILPYLEYKHFSPLILSGTVCGLISILGISIMVLGGSILLVSRFQLGQHGGPKIVIEDNHRLITTGLYRYIRHPI